MRKYLPKIIGGILFITIIIVINLNFLTLTPQEIRDWITGFGSIAPILFMIMYILRPLILFPASVFSIVAGMTFGVVEGTIYTIFGATMGAALSFVIARKMRYLVVKPLSINGGKLEEIQEKIEKKGFFYVLFLRVIPIINFDLISYTSGISRVKFRPFVLATLLGIIPGTFAYTFLGNSFLSGNWKVVLIATLIVILLIAIPIMIKRSINKSEKFE